MRNHGLGVLGAAGWLMVMGVASAGCSDVMPLEHLDVAPACVGADTVLQVANPGEAADATIGLPPGVSLSDGTVGGVTRPIEAGGTLRLTLRCLTAGTHFVDLTSRAGDDMAQTQAEVICMDCDCPADAECRGGTDCSSGSCDLSTCTCEAAPGCGATDECRADGDCSSGSCDTSTCTCRPATGGVGFCEYSCASGESCPYGTCTDGACIDDCRTGEDCSRLDPSALCAAVDGAYKCILPCTMDDECSFLATDCGGTADDGTQFCERRCTSAADCSGTGDLECVEGVCRCTSDAGCAEDSVCVFSGG